MVLGVLQPSRSPSMLSLVTLTSAAALFGGKDREQQTWSRIPGQLPVAPTDSEIYTSSAFERAWTGGAVAKQVAGRRVSIGSDLGLRT